MKRRARRGLGSTFAVHTAEATRASDQIEKHAAATVNAARHNKCTHALLSYAEMQQAIGRFEAHNRSGGKAYKPATAISAAAYEFSMHCVPARGGANLDGARRRR